MLLVPGAVHTPLTIDALLCVVAERDAEVALLKLLVDKLKAQLARRAREQYGASSERLDAQLTLIEAEVPTAEPAQPHSAAPPPKTRARRPRDQRQLPKHLPRETRIHHPAGYAVEAPCGCSACGAKLRPIGRDVAEQLEYVPGHFARDSTPGSSPSSIGRRSSRRSARRRRWVRYAPCCRLTWRG